MIAKELLGYNADLICLQEVDRKVFNHNLAPLFRSEGLEGIFALKGGEVSEGVAVFWWMSKFTMESHQRLVLSEALESKEYLKEMREVVESNEALTEMVMGRTTALMTVLLRETAHTGRRILLGS